MPRKMLCRTRNALFPSLSALLVAACAALPGTPEPSGERPCVPCPSCAPCPGAAPAATPGAPAAPAAP
ncbi:MAG TPA: murein transglycosylase, partial [Thauera aminoaromatica]|nr:murein transglycosylase [Thauera aminoaromatica]